MAFTLNKSEYHGNEPVEVTALDGTRDIWLYHANNVTGCRYPPSALGRPCSTNGSAVVGDLPLTIQTNNEHGFGSAVSIPTDEVSYTIVETHGVDCSVLQLSTCLASSDANATFTMTPTSTATSSGSSTSFMSTTTDLAVGQFFTFSTIGFILLIVGIVGYFVFHLIKKR